MLVIDCRVHTTFLGQWTRSLTSVNLNTKSSGNLTTTTNARNKSKEHLASKRLSDDMSTVRHRPSLQVREFHPCLCAAQLNSGDRSIDCSARVGRIKEERLKTRRQLFDLWSSRLLNWTLLGRLAMTAGFAKRKQGTRLAANLHI